MPSISIYKRKRRQKDGTTKASKVYWAEIRFGRKGPKFFRSTGKTIEREAKEAAKEMAQEIERKEAPFHGIQLMTIDTMFGRWWLEHGKNLKGADIEKFRVNNVIVNFTQDLPIKDINDVEVNKFIQNRLNQDASIPTIKREVTTLRSALNRASIKWGEKIGHVNWKDHKLKDSPDRDIYATPDEMSAIIQNLSLNIKLAALWSLYGMTRLGETKTLRRSDVYPKERFCFVDGKTGKRRVQLSDTALKILDTAMRVNDDPIYVFDLTNRRRQWERARKLAKRADVRWHDLRHIGASWLSDHSNDPTKSQKALGHTNFKTTMKYIHAQGGSLQDALNTMPQIADFTNLDAEEE